MRDILTINNRGHLEISGVDTIQLVEKYGTPLYVLDESEIRKICREYKNSIEQYCGTESKIYYASKAFNCKEICRIIANEGLNLDVVSGGELYTALSVNFPVDRINFHGNNKTREELMLALDNDIGTITVDNFYELEMLDELANKFNKVVNILLRISPNIDSHTHKAIKTGQIDSKFGFIINDKLMYDSIEFAIKSRNINLIGLHCHIGSQLLDVEPFLEAIEVMTKLILEIRTKFNYAIRLLNLGGGFGIRYDKDNKSISYSKCINSISKKLEECKEKYDIDIINLALEPGRSIVGEAGITLYKIGNIKKIPSKRTYVCIDGGMFDNPRYALYKAQHTATIANKANNPKNFVATIAGKCCESGDIISENVNIQVPKQGDILAVFSTGAYNYSMASRYNRNCVPAVVTVNKGKSKVIIKRETYEDIIKNDI